MEEVRAHTGRERGRTLSAPERRPRREANRLRMEEKFTVQSAPPPHRPLPPLAPRSAPLPVAPRWGPGSPVPGVSLRSSSPPVLRPPRAPVPPPLPPKSADAMSRFAVRELHEGGQVRRRHGEGEGGGGAC